MKNNFSFIEKYPFKYVLSVCLFLVFMDFSCFIRIFFLKQSIHIIRWLPFGLGLTFIFMAVINMYNRIEKIATIAFGVALILNSFIGSLSHQLGIFLLIILLDITGTVCFWLAYNKLQLKNHYVKPQKINLSIILFFLLLILLIPAIIFWLFGSWQGK